MADLIEFWRDVTVGSPNDTVTRYRYDRDTDTVSSDVFNPPTGNLGPVHPVLGTKLSSKCYGLDLVELFSRGNNSGLDKVVTEDSGACCTLFAGDFSVIRTNNTNMLTPNGTITITAPTLDIEDYQASIDGGDTYVPATAGEIVFENLPGGNYAVLIRDVSGPCGISAAITIADIITYPPLLIEEDTQPDLYSPVFHPISLGYRLLNNTATVKSDVNGTYLEVGTQDGKDYLATLPIIKIINNEDYEGHFQITGVDDTGDPNKFYLNLTYTTDQIIVFVPFDRQVFQLFCEVSFNNYQKIAEIAAYPNNDGEYVIRLEGFLQSAFEVETPVNEGIEMSMLRKYYVIPRDFDMESAPTVFNAVYSAVEDLTPYLDDLVPLGPAPINFISQLTHRGMPVLFSYIDTTVGRIKNITSSNQTDVISTDTLVLINGLPLNVYDFVWVNPAGVIADLQVSPALPDWITLLPSAADTVKLTIDTGVEVEGGDYEFDDYSSDDYLTGGVNAIVGCHEFEFSDGVTPLFTLRICIFPLQTSNELCVSTDNFNIAWVNREGGWSSYVFEGRKVYGMDIGTVKTYKRGRELKRASVEEVYNTAEVTIANKSIQDLEFIKSLRQSIQAYLWSDQTQGWTIPIILDKENFEIYTKPFRQIEQEGSFSFKYAEEIVIQTQ